MRHPRLPPPARNRFNRVRHCVGSPKEHRQLLRHPGRTRLLSDQPAHDHIAHKQEQSPILEAAATLASLLKERYRTGGIALLAGGNAEQDQDDGRTDLIPGLLVGGLRLLPQAFRLLVVSPGEGDAGESGPDVGGAPPISLLLAESQRLFQQPFCLTHRLLGGPKIGRRTPPEVVERPRDDVGILQATSQRQGFVEHGS